MSKARIGTLDRPPRWHNDMEDWSWKRALVPRHEDFSPLSVPRAHLEGKAVVTGPSGEPRRPPTCWVPPPPPPVPKAKPSGASFSSPNTSGYRGNNDSGAASSSGPSYVSMRSGRPSRFPSNVGSSQSGNWQQ